MVKTPGLVSNAGGTGSVPGQGTKIPHAVWCGPKKKGKMKQELQGVRFESGSSLLVAAMARQRRPDKGAHSFDKGSVALNQGSGPCC